MCRKENGSRGSAGKSPADTGGKRSSSTRKRTRTGQDLDPSTSPSPPPPPPQPAEEMEAAISGNGGAEMQVQQGPVAVRNESPSATTYENQRQANMQRNKEHMDFLGLSAVPLTKPLSPRPPRIRKAGDVNFLPFESPTRRQTNLQNQEILVVLGGELGCNSPVHSKTFNLLLPLSSENANTVKVWKGMGEVLR